jgi:hypothetical protein
VSTIYIATNYAVFSAVLVYLQMRIFRLQRLTLLHLSAFYYVLTTLLFLPLLQGNDYFEPTDEVWRRAFTVGVIFCSGCIVADRLFYRVQPASSQRFKAPNDVALAVYLLLFVFGAVGFVRFFFLGGAYQHFGEVVLSMRAGTSYDAARASVANSIGMEVGRGVAHATGALFAVFPVVIAISFMMYQQSRRVTYLLIAATCVILSLLIASITMQRAPLLCSVGVPALMMVLFKHQLGVERRLLQFLKWRRLIVLSCLLVGCAAAVYTLTNKTGIVVSSRTAFDRLFVIPGLTSLFYYGSFPDPFPFRGMEKLFYLGSELTDSDVTTRQIAQHITGQYSMNADSGFLATAYTAGGYPACLLATTIYLFVVVVVDRVFRKQPGYIRSVNILVNACGIAALTEVPLGVALTVSGFALPSLFLFIFLQFCRSVPLTSRPDMTWLNAIGPGANLEGGALRKP